MELRIEGAESLSVLSFETGESAQTSDRSVIEDITDTVCSHKFIKNTEKRGGENIKYEFASGYHITWHGADGSIKDELSLLSETEIYYKGYFYNKEDCRCIIDMGIFELMFSEGGVRSFIASVIERTDTSLLVEPAEGEDERGIADRIWISGIAPDYQTDAGSIVNITYGGEIMKSYPAKINAYSCKKLTDARDIKYFGQWLDKESSLKQGDGRSSDLIITAIFSDCFFAIPVYPLPDQIKINGYIGDDWCVGDKVYVEYDNAYTDSDHIKTEGDLVSIKQSTLVLDPNMGYKPVIYLYPEKETEVSVKLTLDGRLTCTYPDYGDGWTVIASPDGALTDKHGQTYNYLYWEGETYARWDMSRGFCVKGEDTAAFLEHALAELGLNRREANEFIVFWLPLMQNNPYNIISFQTDVYTESAKLSISPSPDTLIRVFMAYMPSNTYIEIEEQPLSAPERSGFTVIEWGGTQIN